MRVVGVDFKGKLEHTALVEACKVEKATTMTKFRGL
jgi:hypothetical protein